jgi:polyisoprenoid-binding protein YceI
MKAAHAWPVAALMAALPLAACITAPTPSIPLPEVRGGEALYVIDPAHTYPHFGVTHLGLSTLRGRFNKTSGWIVLDRSAGSGSMTVVIDVNSLDTGDRTLEQRLLQGDFLDAENHPTMTFRSNRLHFRDDVLTGVDGELTLRGVTRPVSLTVTSFRCAPLPLIRIEACGANAEARLRRADFGISIYPSMIGAEIELLLPIEAHRR